MCFLPSVNLHHLADAGTDAMTRVSGPSFRMHALRLMLPPPTHCCQGALSAWTNLHMCCNSAPLPSAHHEQQGGQIVEHQARQRGHRKAVGRRGLKHACSRGGRVQDGFCGLVQLAGSLQAPGSWSRPGEMVWPGIYCRACYRSCSLVSCIRMPAGMPVPCIECNCSVAASEKHQRTPSPEPTCRPLHPRYCVHQCRVPRRLRLSPLHLHYLVGHGTQCALAMDR